MAASALSMATLVGRLDYLLNPVLSTRRSAGPLARQLASLPRAQQDFVLQWTEVITRTNYELAYQFAASASAAFEKMDMQAMEAWIIAALDTYDREGLHSGSEIFRQVDAWTQATVGNQVVSLERNMNILGLFACGLSGRKLSLDTAAEPWTDTETLYLPAHISALPTRAENFNIYKILIALLWAQGRYGSFQADLAAACAGYPDPVRAGALLSHIENLRLEACIARVLPGIARDMAKLHVPAFEECRSNLSKAATTVNHSLQWLQRLYGIMDAPRLPHRTALRTETLVVREARIKREQGELAQALAELAHEYKTEADNADGNPDRFRIEVAKNAEGDATFELKLEQTPVPPPEHVSRLIDSILQDLGEIPEDYLQSATDSGRYDSSAVDENAPGNPRDETESETGTYLYNEWDCKRRNYRKNWCTLRESDVQPADNDFVASTLAAYRPQIIRFRRIFEMLRGEDRMLKRQAIGDEIDFDALVSGHIDLKSGLELPDRLLMRRHKTERDLAVLLMIDMSGSTKGWINDAEREALIMLCEALEALGDRYAIYGFSGVTRKRCEIYRIKRFDEPYDDTVRCRIAGIEPQDYTRMGAAIRHLTRLLDGVDARTKLLITLSDGKPDDYSDHYRGEYGIEDTRQALIEAQRTGIKPFCITIDHEARDYLPHLYGPVNWTLVDDVRKLPVQVADIYRRLTA